jgi:hypothetical protein
MGSVRSTVRPVVLRGAAEITDPLGVVLRFLQAYRQVDRDERTRSMLFGEPDLRRANRAGARISAAEIEALAERRTAIEAALGAIAPDASLARSARDAPWAALRQLFGAFADVRGIGISKVTKALHPKRPALIPMLDSVVQAYLADDDPGVRAAFDERGLASSADTSATSTETASRWARCGVGSQPAVTSSPRCGSSTS